MKNSTENNSTENNGTENIRSFSSRSEIETEAADWLARLDGDQRLSPTELTQLKEWVERSPAHRQTLQDLAAFWGQANILTELSVPLYREPAEPARRTLWGGRLGASPVFASISALGFVLLTGLWLMGSSPSLVSGNGIYQTRVGEQNTITLRDGSVIELNTDSEVQVNYNRQRRAIALTRGEAHFTVSKDAQRPFEVTAGQGVVRAVGTAFAVHFQRQALDVTVTEGTVALTAIASPQAANDPLQDGAAQNPAHLKALVAGQSVTFKPLLADALGGGIESLPAEQLQQKLAWREGLMLFDGESLAAVVKEMNRYTHATIEIADPSIAGLAVGGQFRVGETDAMLKNLSISFNLEVDRVNNNLIRLSKKLISPSHNEKK